MRKLMMIRTATVSNMRLVTLFLLVLVGSSALAIPRPDAGLEQARANTELILRFKVLEVRYEQRGGVLFTHAVAEVLELIRGDTTIGVGSSVKISYGAGYVEERRQIEKMQREKQPGLGPAWQLARLREGQVATGWFNLGGNKDVLVPALGYRSFETEVVPDTVELLLEEEVSLELGQVARYTDGDFETRIVRFELVGRCPPNMVCVHGGFWLPILDIIRNGRHSELLLQHGQPTPIPHTELTIHLLKTDGGSNATIVLSRDR